ncbi:hypothetical protein ACN1C3_30170 [Pseudomonas sp. H11T01]|uniref:hypothetical protein n=1 Tax=Pseudomonas sp. H11T01 TaxID=3402749 RepID=UPI003ACE801B
MTRLRTTALSTEETDALVDALPPEHAALLRKACDTYDKACKKAQAARGARTEACEALVTEAIHAKRARLEKEPRCKWTSILMNHFDKRDITIDEEVVRRVVKGFPGF